MAKWQIAAAILGVLCFVAGGLAFDAGTMGLAVGLWIAGFVLVLVAGAWTYLSDALGIFT